MRGMRVVLATLIASLLGAGCAGVPTAAPKTGGTKTAKTGPLKPSPSASVAPDTTPSTLPSSTNNLVKDAYYGRVLGLDGKPAGNILVRGQLVANNGGGLLGNNGSNLVSNNGSGVVSAGGSNYKVQQAGTVLMTRTDADGYFELMHPNNQALNVEAELQEDIKAIRMNVGADLKKFELQLAYTGLISGKVAAPDRPEVTNFEGVRVYIPGTSYQATADAAGNFTLTNVPVGAFRLVAEKTGLGIAVAENVTVKSKETTTAGQLALKIDLPTVSSVSVPNAAAGTKLTIKGQNFGASKGTTFSVAIGGVTCQDAKRVDDATLEATVPAGAANNVVVTVDGIPSAAFPFKSISKLKLVPDSVTSIDEESSDNRLDVDMGSSVTFKVEAYDKVDQPIASPSYTWETPTSSAFTFANGVVTGKQRGKGDLVVRSGELSARMTITVYDPDAAETEVDPSGLILVDGELYARTDYDVYRWDAEEALYTPLGVGDENEEDSIACIAPAPDGGFFMAMGNKLYEVDDTGTRTERTVSNLGTIDHLSATADGTLYLVTGGTTLKKLAVGASTASVLATGLDYPDGMVANEQGHIFVFSENQIYKSTGAAPAAFAKLPRDYYVGAWAVDGTNLYVTDNTTVKKVAADGTITTISTGTDWPSAIAVANGKLYVADGNTSTMLTITLP